MTTQNSKKTINVSSSVAIACAVVSFIGWQICNYEKPVDHEAIARWGNCAPGTGLEFKKIACKQELEALSEVDLAYIKQKSDNAIAASQALRQKLPQ